MSTSPSLFEQQLHTLYLKVIQEHKEALDRASVESEITYYRAQLELIEKIIGMYLVSEHRRKHGNKK